MKTNTPLCYPGREEWGKGTKRVCPAEKSPIFGVFSLKKVLQLHYLASETAKFKK